MTILEDVSNLPDHPEGFKEYLKPGEKIYLDFVSSRDPVTNRMWCSDCRDTHPNVEISFSHAKQKKVLAFIEVGNKEEWKDPNNKWRKNWNLTAIPTLIKVIYGPPENPVLDWSDRLVENELMNAEEIRRFRERKLYWEMGPAWMQGGDKKAAEKEKDDEAAADDANGDAGAAADGDTE